MVAKNDWRRMGQEEYLMDAKLQYVDRYTPCSETWEHEHCAFCNRKISTYEGDLHSGYCTTDNKQSHWLCPACFDDFKEEFQWNVTKIPFEIFGKIMERDVVKKPSCIEVCFSVDGYPEYGSCWLGKMPDRETGLAVYWYGLVEDGSQAYDFASFDDFASAPVFQGKSLKDIWCFITLWLLDGCSPGEMLAYYLKGKKLF